MPGKIIMDQDGAVGSQDLKKDRSHAQEAPLLPHISGAVHEASDQSAVQGANGAEPNGTPSTAADTAVVTNGGSAAPSAAPASSEDIPDLDQSWRETASYRSLGSMMERQAQFCYLELNACLTSMSQIQVDPQPQQPNGASSHTALDSHGGSLAKKRLLLDFARKQREHFIKTLVLSDWCRNEADMARLIDIKVWQDKQIAAQVTASRAVGQTKINMIGAKMPNPNIEGAMELLSTGKASWVPDLGYIPPKRLPAKELLQTLRNMNVILATRLSLHEELPAYMHDYTIADGRATFTVGGEFQVDLSIADEDPSTPFYFIDVRLLYKPSSSVLSDGFRAQAEWRLNSILAAQGLTGCYDFLHNFVLTHKINALRSQATDMLNGKWFDCIRMETLRRSLVIQYWIGKPGKKSWIEFGISSGKDVKHPRKPPTPYICVRWFRQGLRVTDETFQFNFESLDLERYVSTIIARHTSWLLGGFQQSLRDLAATPSSLQCELKKLEAIPWQCSLALSLPSMRKPMTVSIHPVTGQISLSPLSRTTREVEHRLNSDANADVTRWLMLVICAAAQERLTKRTQLVRWQPVSGLVRQENLRALFGDFVRFSVFVPSSVWGAEWALVVTFSLGGESWWVAQLGRKRDERGEDVGKVIVATRPLSPDDFEFDRVTASQLSLLSIEKAAVAEIAFAALSNELNEMHVPQAVQRLERSNVRGANIKSSRAILIKFSALMKGFFDKGWKPWAEETIRLTHHGLSGGVESAETGLGNMRHDLRLSLEPGKLKNLEAQLVSRKNQDLAMNSTGGLALKMLTPFGQPFAHQIQKRLQTVQRLENYAAVLRQRNFRCTDISLSRIGFVYSSAPELAAQLTFSHDGSLPVRLKLEPPDTNPHLRIRVILEQGFNHAGESSFRNLSYVLSLTLPLLTTFERLESEDPRKHVRLHPRTSTWFTAKYSGALPTITFQIRLRSRNENGVVKAMWHIQESPPQPPSAASKSTSNGAAAAPAPPEDLIKALRTLWAGRGDHWLGLNNGVAADALGIEHVLTQLDETVRRFDASAVPAATAQSGAQPQQQPPKPSAGQDQTGKP